MDDKKAPFMLPTLEAAPGYRRVSDLIEKEILAGRIKLGDLLPTEGDLAVQLGVHRSTIREGIRSLENSGLIKRVGAKRMMVSIPDNQAIAWAMTRAMSLHKVSFLDLWEVQMQLEPYCAELASQRVTDGLAKALAKNVEALRENLDDDHRIIELDVEFHDLVAKAANNMALILSREPISILLTSATLTLYERVPQARMRLLQAHEQICRAVVDHNTETARLWMAKHIRDFRRGYMVAGIDLDAPIRLGPDAGHYRG